MRRSDFLKRIGLVVGAIAAMPAIAIKAIKSTALSTNSYPVAFLERWEKDIDGLWHYYVHAIPPERFYKDGVGVKQLPFHIISSSSPDRISAPPEQP